MPEESFNHRGDMDAASSATGHGSNGTWDIFVGEHADGALWLGWALAKQLASRGERVRLFSECLTFLAQRVVGVQEQLELQQVGGVTVSRSSRAAGAWPASNVLQVLGAPLPSAYLHRLLYRSTESRWLQLESIEGGRVTTSPMTPLEDHLGCRSFLVQVGNAPSQGGYIHQSPTPMRQVQIGSVDPDSSVRGWRDRLGLDCFARGERFTIYVDARASRLIVPWLDVWRSLRLEFRVIIECPESGDLAIYGVRKVEGEGGGVAPPSLGQQVIALPLCAWDVSDEVLCNADLALIGDSVSCVRVASMGIPMLPLLPKPQEDDSLIRWYCDGSRPDVAEILYGLSQWGGDLLTLSSLWSSYMAGWEAAVSHAHWVAKRIENGSNLTDTLLGR